ncbi:hypothetical protein M9H77_34374 [Catharanthus roseus]|uniref:Uncharacterized protein n=1 Tax=Catharanthus roseus TaxID=4058 RepID=A0ACB9ZLW0_CATRO|nr:hypothetical protein M9H77_34374 [Catharanthus roseus]
MKLIPSIFKNKENPLQWPSCKQPKTLSFRAAGDQEMFKTVNSVYFDPNLSLEETVETMESSCWFTNSESAASLSTESIEEYYSKTEEDSLEMIVQGIRSSERLFFEPGEAKLTTTGNEEEEEEGLKGNFGLKESIVLALESEDPYLDFKSSMAEMVETHGLKDWESLEELLGWYLKMNGKINHGFIVGAFVDLLIGLASSATSCSKEEEQEEEEEGSNNSFISASSASLSSPFSPLSSQVDEQKEMIINDSEEEGQFKIMAA